jgi:ketosteroid isomerase-like protein
MRWQGEEVMRHSLAILFVLLSAALAQSQTGPCTEQAVREGKLPMADDAFEYMPPYGKPIVGKAAMQAADATAFSDRTNIKRSWVSEHRIVQAPSGEMAYEYGTLDVKYDTKAGGQHHEFRAVMLNVFKAKNGVCQRVAGTMQPLDEPGEHQTIERRRR